MIAKLRQVESDYNRAVDIATQPDLPGPVRRRAVWIAWQIQQELESHKRKASK